MDKYFSERPSYRLEEVFEEIGAVIDDLGPDEEDVAILAATDILNKENFSSDERDFLCTRIYEEYGVSVS